ncbi:MAG: hypothetical protein E7227_03400 [Clostridiales bacterium]|nr:hypothetical protein [Clostridiales bacterium]
MLGKLLKYEIPAMGRKLLPLYVAWAATAFLLGLTTQSADSKSEFMVVISALLYTAIATAIFVMTIILIVQRYSNSLLGDEAYFNHVLPVSVSAHIGNKVISATLWIFVTVLVAILTALLIGIGAIIVAGPDFSLRDMIHDLMNMQLYWPKHMGLYIVEALIMFITGAVKTIMQIYAAITIGHQAQNHTTLASIGAYIVIMIFESTVGRMLVPLFANVGYLEDGFLNFSVIFIIGVVAAAAFSAIYFFVCKYLMENKLDLN